MTIIIVLNNQWACYNNYYVFTVMDDLPIFPSLKFWREGE